MLVDRSYPARYKQQTTTQTTTYRSAEYTTSHSLPATRDHASHRSSPRLTGWCSPILLHSSCCTACNATTSCRRVVDTQRRICNTHMACSQWLPAVLGVHMQVVAVHSRPAVAAHSRAAVAERSALVRTVAAAAAADIAAVAAEAATAVALLGTEGDSLLRRDCRAVRSSWDCTDCSSRQRR